MDNQNLIFEESSFSSGQLENDFLPFSISSTEEESSIKIELTTTKPKLKGIINYYNKKENFYVKAIKNLIVQNNFLELALQLEEGYVSENEYNRRIEECPERYVVQGSNLNETGDVKIIQDIMKKLGNDFLVEEVAELFSLDEDDLENKMLALKNE